MPADRRVAIRITATTNPQDITAPIVAITLGDKVALLERYQPSDAWAIGVDPDADAWVLRWDRLNLVVTSEGDLALARFVVRQRALARNELRAIVLRVAAEAGLDPKRFRQAVDVDEVRARAIRCPRCGCVGVGHRPGDETCRMLVAERAYSRRDEE